MKSANKPSESLQALLADRVWMRRLALALAGDENTADDLEQEAFLAAMRRPPHTVAAIRGWVRRVMINRLRQIGRTKARVTRRETVAARRDATAATDDVVARAEAQRNVVLAVLDLEEPYRTTVLLRYFEEMTSVEVGERLGIPPNTVRVRLGRALNKLRARLDAEHGERSAWVALLGMPVAAKSAAAGAGASVAAAKLKPALVIGLLTGAALLLGVVKWWSGTSGDTDRAASVSTLTGELDPAGPEGARGGDATAGATVWGLWTFPGTGAVSGEVRFASTQQPAAGVAVRIVRDGRALDLVTGANGYFAFTELAQGGPYRVAAHAPSCADATVEGVAIGPGERVDLGVLWLDRPLVAEVFVCDASGRALAGATVDAFRARDEARWQDRAGHEPRPVARGRTADGGIARFKRLAPASWTFRASLAGYASAGLAAQPLLRGGITARLRIVLTRGHALSGTVVGADGSPLADAAVLALTPREAEHARAVARDPLAASTRTDAGGRYTFTSLPRGGHAIAILPDGGLPCRVGVVEVPAVDRFDIRLDGGTLTGRVTERGTGRSIEGVAIRVAVWRRHSPTILTATTGADGRYTVAVPLSGAIQGPDRGDRAIARDLYFEARKPGWVMAPATDHRQWSMPLLLSGDSLEWDVELRPAAGLRGVVKGPDGPVPGARVVADVWNEFRGSMIEETTTGADGRYAFDALPAGKAIVRVTKPGLVQAPAAPPNWSAAPPPASVVAVAAGAAATRDLEMVDAGWVRGTVVDASGRALDAVAVTATDPSGAAWTATTDTGGSFVLTGPRTGVSVTVRAIRDGYVDGAAVLRATAAGDDATARIQLEKTGTVSGRVVGADGRAAAGAFVQIAPATVLDQGVYGVASVWQRAPRLAVGTDGRFHVPLPWFGAATAGGVYVRAVADGLAPAVSERLDVADGAADAGTIRLEAGHVLRGRVVDRDGAGPVTGARIEIINKTIPKELGESRSWNLAGRSMHPFEIIAVTDAEGRFAVPNLPAWTYEVRISSKAHLSVVVPARVPGDAVQVELSPSLEISGRAQYADGDPVAYAQVLGHTSRGVRQTATDAEGRFVVRWLAQGSVTLEVRPGSSVAVDVLPRRSAPVAAGATDVVLTVARGAGVISGRALAPGGDAIPGAWVSAKPVGGGPLLRVRTTPAGEFAFRGLENSTYTLLANAQRSLGGPEKSRRPLVAELAEVSVGATGVVLAFQPALTITGSVVGPNAKPVTQPLRLRARGLPASKWSLYLPVKSDGTFALGSLVAGRYELALLDPASGKPIAAEGPAVVAAGTSDVKFVVREATTISGRVLDAAGRAVADAQVVATPDDGGETVERWTSLTGAFRLSGLSPDKTYTVVALDHARGSAQRAGLAPGATDVEFRLAPHPRLGARLQDGAGKPVPNARIVLAAGPRRAWLRTDSHGRFATRALPDGEYAVTVHVRNGRELEPPVACGRVRSGSPETVLRLPP